MTSKLNIYNNCVHNYKVPRILYYVGYIMVGI